MNVHSNRAGNTCKKEITLAGYNFLSNGRFIPLILFADEATFIRKKSKILSLKSVLRKNNVSTIERERIFFFVLYIYTALVVLFTMTLLSRACASYLIRRKNTDSILIWSPDVRWRPPRIFTCNYVRGRSV